MYYVVDSQTLAYLVRIYAKLMVEFALSRADDTDRILLI